MAIETRCAGCGTILTIADQHVGQLARCPHCRTEYTIPEASDLAALDAVCHFCGAVLPQTGGMLAEQGFHTCDACQQSIDENAEAIENERWRIATTRRVFVRCGWVVLALVVTYGLLTYLIAV